MAALGNLIGEGAAVLAITLGGIWLSLYSIRKGRDAWVKGTGWVGLVTLSLLLILFVVFLVLLVSSGLTHSHAR
jgi:hypothetical protein